MADRRKTGGRKRGTPNKITTAFKDAVRIVYDDLGGHSAFTEWARENPGDFYKICARLIPGEIASRDSGTTVQVVINNPASLGSAWNPPAIAHAVTGQPMALPHARPD